MARRRICQERLRLEARRRSTGSLEEIGRLIDWTEVDRKLLSIYASAKGEPAWPPLALFKALLLAIWYDLSDVKLAEALDDRASFRRFCGFAADEPTPERTAFVRFRREVLARDLDRVLFASVTDQLDAQGVIVKTGTLVDATLITSASIKSDDEARLAGHRRKKPVHGYKAHVATDEGGFGAQAEPGFSCCLRFVNHPRAGSSMQTLGGILGSCFLSVGNFGAGADVSPAPFCWLVTF